MTAQHALFIYGIAVVVAVVSLAATVCSMEPAYRRTFIGSVTGKQYWVSNRGSARKPQRTRPPCQHADGRAPYF